MTMMMMAVAMTTDYDDVDDKIVALCSSHTMAIHMPFISTRFLLRIFFLFSLQTKIISNISTMQTIGGPS